MHFLTPNEGQIFPEASPTGEQGELLDTQWDIHWPGPGRLYLGHRDLQDIVVPALASPLVQEALETNGWIAPGKVAVHVEELEQQLADTQARLADAVIVQAGFEAALEKLNTSAKTPPAEAAKPKPKTATPKKPKTAKAKGA